jgi:hypothetical protein
LANPFGQGGDRLGRQFFVLTRHCFDVFSFGVVDGKDESADIRFTRNDDWADFAALEDELAGIKTEAGLLFLRTVTLIAMVDEDGADFLFEELQLGGRRGGGLVGGGCRQG